MSEHVATPLEVAKAEGAPFNQQGWALGHWSDDGSDFIPIALLAGRFGERRARDIVVCVNACEGVPTNKLSPGLVAKMVPFVEWASTFDCDCKEPGAPGRCVPCDARSLLAQVGKE